MSESKRLVGEKAASYIRDGMLLGLGTGSTVYYTLLKVAEMIREGMKLRGIPTSAQTERIAREHNIPLLDFAEVDRLDLCIDGADEFDPQLNLIKGGGGALFREKMVASASDRVIIVADASKRVEVLGAFGLPVEVVPFAWEQSHARIQKLGCKAIRRQTEGKPFISDNGNFIFDCDFGRISNPGDLHRQLKLLPGVVETGLFVDLADVVISLTESGELQVLGH